MRVADPTASNSNLKNIYDQGITALGVARDFILPEFVTNPAEATYASIGLDLVSMFPMARVFKGGKTAIDYLRTIDRMGIDDISQELTRLNKARAVNRKNIFAKNNSADQIKKLEADELELSNAIVKKLGDRREQLTSLDTAEKLMGTAGDGSKIIPRFSFGGGVGGFFTSLAANTGGYDPDNADEDMIVVARRPEPINIDYGKIVDVINTGLDIYDILNPRPEIVYPQPPQPQQTAGQQNMGIASMMPSPTINYSGGSDIRLADYLTELERRALRQQMLAELLG
tara:strand:- start:2191 stop:3045 length:855 start_codon:yes stop_codon:yes gene_type:complete